MMRRFQLSRWIILLVLALASQLAFTSEGETLIRPTPLVLEVGKGQVETLQILLVGAKNIYGIDLQATFDPAAVKIVDANPKQDGVQILPGEFLKPDFVVLNVADNKAGTLRYVATQLNPTPPANGEGVVLSVRFLGKVSGRSTKLAIVSVEVADRRGVKLPVTAQDADLVVVPPKPATPTLASTTTLVPATSTLFPTATLILKTPTPLAHMITQPRLQPTPQPTETVERERLANLAEENATFSGRVLTYVTMGGFSGSILLFGLSFWLLTAKRRKERTRRSK